MFVHPNPGPNPHRQPTNCSPAASVIQRSTTRRQRMTKLSKGPPGNPTPRGRPAMIAWGDKEEVPRARAGKDLASSRVFKCLGARHGGRP